MTWEEEIFEHIHFDDHKMDEKWIVFGIWMLIVIVMPTTSSYTKSRRINCRKGRK